MLQLINILHILVAVCIIALVLIQRGKGSDMGAGFGTGASATVFGSQGSTPFLVKLTAILALVFFITSAVMSLLVGKGLNATNAVPIPMDHSKTIPSDES